MFMSFFLDSGANSGSAPAGGGGSTGKDSGGGAVSNPPPGGGAVISPPAVAAAATFTVPPVALPYNLSILSNKPVLVITVGVALSYSPTALSILCCCKSKRTSSSDQPKMCFLAHVDEVA